ncbi:MAG: hemolysin family protein [Flavobacteriales bacterium]
MNGTDLSLILVSILVSALCSGLEIALLSSNKLYLELERKRGAIWARVLGGLLQRPARVIGTLVVGNTIALVLYGSVLSHVIAVQLAGMSTIPSLLLQILACTLVILVAGEFIPKLLFRMDPNRALALFAFPLVVVHVVLWLPMIIVTAFGEAFLRLFGVNERTGHAAFGRVDLDDFLKDMSTATETGRSLDAEVEYFRNTLELSRIKARDLMVPRAEIEAIPVEESISVLKARFVDTGMTKLLVHTNNMDDILGYVHGYELFRHPRSIRAILRPVNFIPGTMPADEVLQLFIKQRSHVAVVVDEFGGTAGMLTMEDVVETIVGDIEDEHDTDEEVAEQLGPNEFLLSGRAEVAGLIERFRLALPESDEYETLAGFVLHSTGGLPEQGQVIELPPFRVTVAQVVHSRIDLVRLEVTDPVSGFLP